MNETVLLYNLSGEQRVKLPRVFMLLRIRMVFVDSSQYGKSIGQLLGKEDCLPDIKAVKEAEQKKDTISMPMMVMSGFDNGKLDMLLKSFRQHRIPSIALKAIVTPYNMNWTSLQLYEELQREHEEFQKRKQES